MSDLSELMQKDPLSLTVEDVTELVKHYRDKRAIYIQGVQPLKTEKVKPAKGSVDLSNLDIKL